jgi:histidyl-tRNA synthetase
MIQLIKGFKDILPNEIALWQEIEQTARSIFENFGYTEIRLPILEKADLFARSIGDTTDIVEKEMYSFPDGKRGLVTLRPEATASFVRSYIQQKMYAKDPIQKLFTIGPMFRKERPQKGRYRQFYQIDAEVFGIDAPLIDAQIIFMLMTLFSRLKVSDVFVLINSLGCPKCRPDFQKGLLEMLSKQKDNLCENCVRRSTKNPLRVLDCKVPSCKEAVKGAPSITDYLCEDCDDHFNIVKKTLDRLNVKYKIDKSLVRGLDYYTRTIFEIQTTSLGAQSAVAGGGRYDGLVESLDGPSQPAIGFAIGFDRLVEIMSQERPEAKSSLDLFIIALGEKCQQEAFEWLCELSLGGIKTDMNYGKKSLKSLMKRADKLNAAFVIIIGEEELKTEKIILRNMQTKEQVSIPTKGIVDILKSKIKIEE